MVAVVTVAILAGLWFGLVRAQQNTQAGIKGRIQEMQDNNDKAVKKLKQQKEIEESLESFKRDLKEREESMPNAVSGSYQWFILVMNRYIAARSLNNFTTSPPSQPGDVRLMPSFPYRAITFTVSLNALYRDFGKFLADFENDWPFLRVQNISVRPVSAAPGDERLDFQFEVVSLAMTNAPAATLK